MKTTLLANLFLAILLSSSFNLAQAQMAISDDLTAVELVDDFFNSGVLVDISNITFNGMGGDDYYNQTGLFSNGLAAGFPMESGLAMGTAVVATFVGESAEWIDPSLNTEIDIMAIANTESVNNCAVLEFDVIVNADALVFNYIFASTEYHSFTCSQFNDAFGLFVSGPGIEGEFTNEAINIATIPNSNTPVSINSVNGGVATGAASEQNCIDANPNWLEDSMYFIENYDGVASNISHNGYTVNLEAYVAVVLGETYHFKFAICDVLDGALDSGVFLESSSFKGLMLTSTDYPELDDLTLFPNPATDELKIHLETIDGQQIFEIMDVQGRMVKSVSANGAQTVTIPVQDLDLGFYFVNQYTNGALVARAKFVKE